MCRVFGAVASDPISIRHELIESSNPMIRLSEDHDSGWGLAAYPDLGCASPVTERFPTAAFSDGRFDAATELRGRIFNVHVRRATLGGLSAENTHPFEFGPYSFSHNGTILGFRSLLRPGMSDPLGQTDSECFFLRLMHDFDPSDPVRSIRRTVAAVVAGHTFSGVNFVFSDGNKLYAYKLGIFDLFWTTRPGVAMVASEPLTRERWHRVQQDVLISLDPEDPEEPTGERLLGDELVEIAQIEKLEPDAALRREARGLWAAEYARKVSTNGHVAAGSRSASTPA
ncbi:MAG: class II glutamine amidotransferase [Thermoleophilaceae bacterium]|nr:class II glutamine amidotransferase [Thermoleophilaceae bacterium]